MTMLLAYDRAARPTGEIYPAPDDGRTEDMTPGRVIAVHNFTPVRQTICKLPQKGLKMQACSRNVSCSAAATAQRPSKSMHAMQRCSLMKDGQTPSKSYSKEKQ